MLKVNNNRNLFEQLLKKDWEQYNNNQDKNKRTFLSLINRNYYENYISKLLLYTLVNDKDLFLLKRLIKKYKEKLNSKLDNYTEPLTIVDYCVEKSMGVGRADIFIELRDKDKKTFTVTLENKIDAVERIPDDGLSQTEIYFDYVNKYYKESINIFIYLTPEFNYTAATCNQFMNMTYKQLYKLIPNNSDDYIITDFKQHIGGYLLTMKFSDAELFYLNNYEAIDSIRTEAEKKFDMFRHEILNYLITYYDDSGKIKQHPYAKKQNVKDGEIVIVAQENNQSLQIMREGDTYYSYKRKKDAYFFFTELRIEYNFSIVCQNVIRGYDSTENGIVKQFINNNPNLQPEPRPREWDKKLDYIYSSMNYEGYEQDLISEKGMLNLKKWVHKTITKLFRELDQIVHDFHEWKDKK